MSWTLAVRCELYRRDYLEIYDRRFWVKELNPKVQEIRRRLLDLKTTTRKPSQFHQKSWVGNPVLLARLYREYVKMSGMTQRAYKYRFYPTTEQESLLRRTMGCVRLVYNKALAARTDAWYQTNERVGYEQTSSMLTSWKKEQELDFQGRG